MSNGLDTTTAIFVIVTLAIVLGGFLLYELVAGRRT